MTTGEAALARVAEALRRARTVTALTGAGVSAASGIPTFRGAAGLWKTFRAEDLATPAAFARDPRLVWEWYDWRRQLIRDAVPNDAHHVLARWSRDRSGFTLITQNVDGLHERAGRLCAEGNSASRAEAQAEAGAERLIRLHGSIWHVRCWARCAAGRADWHDDRAPLPAIPPRCPHCDDIVRPGVVWFGENLDVNVIDAATSATACDVFLTIGTSSLVYPAANFVHQARRRGAMTVEINLDATAASDLVDISLRGKAEEILTELARRT